MSAIRSPFGGLREIAARDDDSLPFDLRAESQQQCAGGAVRNECGFCSREFADQGFDGRDIAAFAIDLAAVHVACGGDVHGSNGFFGEGRGA